MVPWSSGKLLVRDVTCIDSFAPSYIAVAASQVGTVAIQAEERRVNVPTPIGDIFYPVVVESTGLMGLKTTTDEERSYSYLIENVCGRAEGKLIISTLVEWYFWCI